MPSGYEGHTGLHGTLCVFNESNFYYDNGISGMG